MRETFDVRTYFGARSGSPARVRPGTRSLLRLAAVQTRWHADRSERESTLENRDMVLLFITHDLDLATAICDRIAVMYAGQIIEIHPGTSTPCIRTPRPLLRHGPICMHHRSGCPAIAGRPASAAEVGDGCAFAPRCRYAACVCEVPEVALRPHGSGSVRCVRADELGGVLRCRWPCGRGSASESSVNRDPARLRSLE
jgi:hypothetical protein